MNIYFILPKEMISFGPSVSDNFQLDNQGAPIRIFVEGNSLSHTFRLIAHGVPGTDFSHYNTDYIS